jgi:hypothetical protein
VAVRDIIPRRLSGHRRATGDTVGSHRVTLIPGDGVGPELVDATRIALEATGVAFDWDVQSAGCP